MNYLLKGGNIVNEGEISQKDIFIKNGKIERIGSNLTVSENCFEINCEGKHLFPGMIDDQVHFREPGLTHKANIHTESMAAVAGGVTSFMEMPNTVPNALTQELLEEKYQIASKNAIANYSFFMGASNDNIEEVKKTSKTDVCGLKIFMGSSTGNMLVDKLEVLERLFCETNLLIATHCEDEATVRKNLEKYQEKYQERGHARLHPIIRDVDACYLSSSKAIELAKSCQARLHILHITTAEELELFDNTIPLKDKNITSEACVHHLFFDAEDYEEKGNLIKCNPAIKESRHKKAILKAIKTDKIDVIATDHAPHTWEEKQKDYWNAPAGLPLVQHPLLILFDFYKKGELDLPTIARKTAHAVADCFNIEARGYLREGYWADIFIADLKESTRVKKEELFYKCGWSPFEGYEFPAKIEKTFVSGKLVYSEGKVNDTIFGKRLRFNRD